jgi:3-methyladenine DNA glycosylase AlkC
MADPEELDEDLFADLYVHISSSACEPLLMLSVGTKATILPLSQRSQHNPPSLRRLP